MILTARTTADGRTLKKLITALLKSWLVSQIDRVNYVQSYLIDPQDPKKTQKQASKLLYISIQAEKKSELLRLLDKLATGICSITVIQEQIQ